MMLIMWSMLAMALPLQPCQSPAPAATAMDTGLPELAMRLDFGAMSWAAVSKYPPLQPSAS